MTSERCIFIVGPFPPPVHGMSTTNAAVSEQLQVLGANLVVIDTATPSLDRSIVVRLGRIPRILRGLARLATTRKLQGETFYLSAAGGLGQIYNIVYILVARLRGMRIYIRHCSFAYLEMPKNISWALVKSAGSSAVHITQSQGMSDRLSGLYGAKHVVSISNAVLYQQEQAAARVRKEVKTLSFLSNLSAEKGIFEFLELMAEAEKASLPITAKLAGPFQDAETQRRVNEKLEKLANVQWVGPVYGADKDRFFADVDVLIFPTRYDNETEAKVNHEAMSRAIPVIAYGRGCIPEIVGADCGLVIDPGQPFVPAARAQIEGWLAEPAAFEAASKAAAERFAQTYVENHARWQALLSDLTGSIPAVQAPETEDFPSQI